MNTPPNHGNTVETSRQTYPLLDQWEHDYTAPAELAFALDEIDQLRACVALMERAFVRIIDKDG